MEEELFDPDAEVDYEPLAFEFPFDEGEEVAKEAAEEAVDTIKKSSGLYYDFAQRKIVRR